MLAVVACSLAESARSRLVCKHALHDMCDDEGGRFHAGMADQQMSTPLASRCWSCPVDKRPMPTCHSRSIHASIFSTALLSTCFLAMHVIQRCAPAGHNPAVIASRVVSVW